MPLDLHPNQDGRIPVMFRATGPAKAPQVVAVFPCAPQDAMGHTVVCMSRGGGEAGACTVKWLSTTRPAKPLEYATLERVLQAPPHNYQLDTRYRLTPDMVEVRNSRAANRFLGGTPR